MYAVYIFCPFQFRSLICLILLFKSTAYFYDIIIRQFYKIILLYISQSRNKIEYQCIQSTWQLHAYILEQGIRNDIYCHVDYVSPLEESHGEGMRAVNREVDLLRRNRKRACCLVSIARELSDRRVREKLDSS